jgi:AcrR family transcriptional regulator
VAEQTKPSRRQRERQRHKTEILNAAMKLFAEKGFHSVSMNEIAAEAEFATGTLYNFFDSKEALYEEIMAQCAERVVSMALPVLERDNEDERDRIQDFIRQSVMVFRENAAVVRLSLQATGGDTAMGAKHKGPAAKRVHERMLGKLTEVFASGMRKRIFRDVDPTVVAIALLAAIEALVFSTAQDSQEGLFERRIAHLEEFFFKGILYAQDQNDA